MKKFSKIIFLHLHFYKNNYVNNLYMYKKNNFSNMEMVRNMMLWEGFLGSIPGGICYIERTSGSVHAL